MDECSNVGHHITLWIKVLTNRSMSSDDIRVVGTYFILILAIDERTTVFYRRWLVC
jgi:hypothetical protein